ncbi:hypothetical protein HK100_004679 [Physocladia obscura]|uniref:Uncharacterized protein n=1 Tax=Physocladia obscura TaxID=109957 RepID=A0AAD5T6W7_9FUNG|nr:hypothetical protein HK100_004679 [Physocladia obscura]
MEQTSGAINAGEMRSPLTQRLCVCEKTQILVGGGGGGCGTFTYSFLDKSLSFGGGGGRKTFDSEQGGEESGGNENQGDEKDFLTMKNDGELIDGLSSFFIVLGWTLGRSAVNEKEYRRGNEDCENSKNEFFFEGNSCCKQDDRQKKDSVMCPLCSGIFPRGKSIQNHAANCNGFDDNDEVLSTNNPSSPTAKNSTLCQTQQQLPSPLLRIITTISRKSPLANKLLHGKIFGGQYTRNRASATLHDTIFDNHDSHNDCNNDEFYLLDGCKEENMYNYDEEETKYDEIIDFVQNLHHQDESSAALASVEDDDNNDSILLSPPKGFVTLNEMKARGELYSLAPFFEQFSANPKAIKSSRKRHAPVTTAGGPSH